MTTQHQRLRVQFIHGLEGSPMGLKARFLAQHFDALTPAMDTGDFAACVAQQAQALESHRPDVLVGSSFGGAVALRLLHEGHFAGPTLLLAQAAGKLGLPLTLPHQIPVTLVHGIRDQVIDLADSRQLAASGDARWVRYIEVDDEHSLSSLVHSGQLAELVCDVWERQRS